MKTRTIALVAMFAALYFVLSLLPGIPCIGIPQIKIQLEASFASIFGAILGPYAGGLAALIGTLVAYLYPHPGPYGLPFILCPAANAVTTGLIFRRKFKIAAALIAAIITAFWFTPVSQPVHKHWITGLAATFDKIIALCLIAPTAWILERGGVLPREGGIRASALTLTQLFLVSFIGNQADSALGCLMFAIPIVYNGIFGLPLETVRLLFMASPFVYPIIRALQALLAAVAGLPLLRVLEARGWLELPE